LPISDLRAFRDDGSINVVVESPRGSGVKFKYDAGSGLIMLSRPLPVGLSYPYDWGFIPGTHAADGDPFDAMVMWDGTSFPAVVLPCRAVGLLQVEQTNLTSRARERNDRVLAAPVKDPHSDRIRGLDDVTARVRAELEQFFLAAVAFEGKNVAVLGWAGADAALSAIREAAI